MQSLITNKTYSRLDALIKKRDIRSASTFKFFNLGFHYNVLVSFMFSNKDIVSGNLYLHADDDVIDHESITNDFNVVMRDLSVSLEAKHES